MSRPTVLASTPSIPAGPVEAEALRPLRATTKASTGSSIPFSVRPAQRARAEPPADLAVRVGRDQHLVDPAPRTAAGWPG